ncbi:MAG: hypothetical protein QOI73_702 [Solirubrobacteraceae bacterium]|nr:hypothetical protein [Solirubrobacteraceae bacterium]
MAIHGSTLKVDLAVVTKSNKLAVVIATPEKYVQVYPTELSPGASMTFQGRPALLLDDAGEERVVYAVTTHGHLVRCNHRDGEWSDYMPTMEEHVPDVTLAGSVAVIAGRTATAYEVYGITTEQRLVRILIDGDATSVDYPVETAVAADVHGLRFAGSPAAIDFDAAAGKRLVYAITTDGVLVELWGEGDRWELGYPADESGEPQRRFRGSPNARLARKGTSDVTKYVAAFTTADELVSFTGKHGSRGLGHFGKPRTFRGDRIAMLTATPDYGGVVLAAVTADRRLVCFDSVRGEVHPAEAAEYPAPTFRGDVRVTFHEGRLFIHAVTQGEKLVQFRSDPIGDPSVFKLPDRWSYLEMGDWAGGGTDVGR